MPIRSLNTIKPKISRHFIKYGIAGVTALAADYVVFIALYYLLYMNLGLAVILSQFSGLIVSFLLNRSWVFATEQKGLVVPQFMKFVVLFMFNTIFSYLAIKYLAGIGVEEYLAKGFTIACIVTWNYAIYKKIF